MIAELAVVELALNEQVDDHSPMYQAEYNHLYKEKMNLKNKYLFRNRFNVNHDFGVVISNFALYILN